MHRDRSTPKKDHSAQLVLAIEPDPGQASAIRLAVGELPGVKLILVSSWDAARASFRRGIPYLILLHALFPPGDEAALTEYLRTLAGAWRVQTLTIPLLEGATPTKKGKSGGLFGAFKRRKRDENEGRCDPRAFAA